MVPEVRFSILPCILLITRAAGAAVAGLSQQVLVKQQRAATESCLSRAMKTKSLEEHENKSVQPAGNLLARISDVGSAKKGNLQKRRKLSTGGRLAMPQALLGE